MRLNIPKYKILLLILDLFILFFSFVLTYNFIISSVINFYGTTDLIYFLIIATLIPLIYIFNFYNNNLYKTNIFLTRAHQIVSIVKSYFFSSIILIFVLFVIGFPFNLLNRQFIVIFNLTSFILIAFIRVFGLKPLFEKLKNTEVLRRKVLIIGAGKSGKLLAAKLSVEDPIGLEIIGFADDNLPQGTQISNNLKVLGTINELAKQNGKVEYEEAIISIDRITYERLMEIIDLYNQRGITVRVNSDLFRAIPENLVTEKFSDIAVITTSPQILSNYSLLFKSIFDRIIALIGILVLLPFFIIIGIIIKLTSKGPIIYKQKRVGKDGKVFDFYKFRSMYVSNNGIDEDPERVKMMLKFMKQKKLNSNGTVKVINEKRVTPIGRVLRKYSLDELPQLFNVLKGDMSLVGPRPCLPYEYENYDEWQKNRLKVLPGCTGVWQVYGRGKVNFNDSVVMDIYYVNNMSPWLDLQLLLKTIPILVLGKGGK
ncbi:MAG: sugar transferase [Ignavibacterium sp.]|nr:sugar transferase [Ignavibacterium sp.]